MRVGHGAARLAVRDGEPMGGYADRVGGVAGERDPLEVHAVSFRSDGSFRSHGRRFVLVVCDLICVNEDLAGAVRSAVAPLGVPVCWVTATHTHAGPESGCQPGGADTSPDLAARVVAAAVAATAAAVGDETAAAGSVARAVLPGLAGVRSSGPEPFPLPVDALAMHADGALRGLLVVLPAHPTVLPADNRAVSADLVGALRRTAAGTLGTAGRPPWVVVATGAAGDVSTRHTRRDRTPAEADRLAGLAAAALRDALDTARPVWSGANGALRGPRLRRIELPAKRPGDVPEHADGAASDRTAYVRRQGAALAADLLAAGRTEPYAVTLAALALGDLRLLAVPAEPYLSVAETVIAATPGPTLVLGYANGYLGYLPDLPAYTSAGYEVLSSAVRPGSAEAVAAAGTELARDLHAPPSS